MTKEEIVDALNGCSAVVTGGTGLIGRQVVRLLCDAGCRVRVVSLDQMVADARAQYVSADLTHFGVCREATAGADAVFHLAGIKGSAKVSESKVASHFVPTLMMNTNVLEACRVNKVKRVVYTSSIGAYANAEVFRESNYVLASEPMDMAGWAKRMAEVQIQAYKTQYGLDGYSVVRPCNVYGPGDNFDPDNAMVIPSLMYRICKGEDPLVVWGDGSAVRDFAFSGDVAEGIILALCQGTGGYPFVNLGSGRGVTIRELVETLRTVVDFNYVFDASKPSGFPKRVMDISLARRVIGYNPTTALLDGLRTTWEWYVNNRNDYLKRKNYFTEGN